MASDASSLEQLEKLAQYRLSDAVQHELAAPSPTTTSRRLFEHGQRERAAAAAEDASLAELQQPRHHVRMLSSPRPRASSAAASASPPSPPVSATPAVVSFATVLPDGTADALPRRAPAAVDEEGHNGTTLAQWALAQPAAAKRSKAQKVNAAAQRIRSLDSGALPRGRFAAVTSLYLGNNALSELRGIARPFPRLTLLSLANNDIVSFAALQPLAQCRALERLYLAGNPIEAIPLYRLRVLAAVPQIASLDGAPVTPAERSRAAEQRRRDDESLAALFRLHTEHALLSVVARKFAVHAELFNSTYALAGTYLDRWGISVADFLGSAAARALAAPAPSPLAKRRGGSVEVQVQSAAPNAPDALRLALRRPALLPLVHYLSGSQCDGRLWRRFTDAMFVRLSRTYASYERRGGPRGKAALWQAATGAVLLDLQTRIARLSMRAMPQVAVRARQNMLAALQLRERRLLEAKEEEEEEQQQQQQQEAVLMIERRRAASPSRRLTGSSSGSSSSAANPPLQPYAPSPMRLMRGEGELPRTPRRQSPPASPQRRLTPRLRAPDPPSPSALVVEQLQRDLAAARQRQEADAEALAEMREQLRTRGAQVVELNELNGKLRARLAAFKRQNRDNVRQAEAELRSLADALDRLQTERDALVLRAEKAQGDAEAEVEAVQSDAFALQQLLAERHLDDPQVRTFLHGRIAEVSARWREAQKRANTLQHTVEAERAQHRRLLAASRESGSAVELLRQQLSASGELVSQLRFELQAVYRSTHAVSHYDAKLLAAPRALLKMRLARQASDARRLRACFRALHRFRERARIADRVSGAALTSLARRSMQRWRRALARRREEQRRAEAERAEECARLALEFRAAQLGLGARRCFVRWREWQRRRAELAALAMAVRRRRGRLILAVWRAAAFRARARAQSQEVVVADARAIDLRDRVEALSAANAELHSQLDAGDRAGDELRALCEQAQGEVAALRGAQDAQRVVEQSLRDESRRVGLELRAAQQELERAQEAGVSASTRFGRERGELQARARRLLATVRQHADAFETVDGVLDETSLVIGTRHFDSADALRAWLLTVLARVRSVVQEQRAASGGGGGGGGPVHDKSVDESLLEAMGQEKEKENASSSPSSATAAAPPPPTSPQKPADRYTQSLSHSVAEARKDTEALQRRLTQQLAMSSLLQ